MVSFINSMSGQENVTIKPVITESPKAGTMLPPLGGGKMVEGVQHCYA